MDVSIKLSPEEAAEMDGALGMAAGALGIIGQRDKAAALTLLRETLRDRYAEAVAIYLVSCSDEEILAWGGANNIDMNDVLKSVETIRERISNA